MEAREEKEAKEPKAEEAPKPNKPKNDHFVGIKGGLKGFLISNDQGKDSQSVREVLELLTNFADKYYPLDVDKSKKNSASFGSIEDSLKAEIQSLKTHEHRRFFKVSTDSKGSYFIKIADDSIEPVSFLSKLFDTAARLSRKGKKSFNMRFTSKILPIEITGQASQEEIMGMARKVIPKLLHPPNKPCKFKIELRKRLNDKLARDTVTASLVKFIASGNKVDLKNADKVVILEIIKGAACMSVYAEKDFPHGFNIKLAAQSRAPLLFDQEDSSDESPTKEVDKVEEKDAENDEKRGMKRTREENVVKAEKNDEAPDNEKASEEVESEEEPKKKKSKKVERKEARKVVEETKPVHIKGGEDSDEEEFRLL